MKKVIILVMFTCLCSCKLNIDTLNVNDEMTLEKIEKIN